MVLEVLPPMLAASVWMLIGGIIVVAVLTFWFLIRRFDLPFEGRLFWKILPAVVALVVAGFWLALKFISDYDEITNADYGGSAISAIILSYLIHLWMLPAEVYPDYDGDADSWTEPDSSNGDTIDTPPPVDAP